MALIEQRLERMQLRLPADIQPPGKLVLPFAFVRVQGTRAVFSGHGPLNDDGSVAQPLGKLGQDLTIEQGYEQARRAALSVLASFKRAIGDLDRIHRWTRVFGMVNSTPGFTGQPAVINGFSQFILELYGEERGRHARSAVGMAALPFDIPVEIEGEVLLCE